MYCKGSDISCCVTDTSKPHGPISDCKYVGQMPPSGAPSGKPNCSKSKEEDYSKALQDRRKTLQALKDIQAKEHQIIATNDRKQIDAWKIRVAATSDNNEKAGQEVT